MDSGRENGMGVEPPNEPQGLRWIEIVAYLGAAGAVPTLFVLFRLRKALAILVGVVFGVYVLWATLKLNAYLESFPAA